MTDNQKEKERHKTNLRGVMEEKYCKNHPQTSTTFRCFQCKQYICTLCRLNLAHHYFCGYSCYLRFQFNTLIKKIKPFQFTILLASQVLLFLTIIFLVIHTNQRFQNITTSSPFAIKDSSYFNDLRTVLEVTQNDSLSAPIFQSGNVMRKDSYSFQFPIKNDWIINVWRNGRPVISEWAPSSGLSTFTLPLEYGQNLVRILVLDQQQRIVYQEQLQLEYRTHTVELLRRSLDRGDPGKKMVALTFDAGSDNNHTHEILAILNKYQLKCTLFLTGKFIERYPEIVQGIVANGHEVANHTYSHPHLTFYIENRQHQLRPEITREFIQKQLQKTDSVFYALTGSRLKPYWRAPFGEYNEQILIWAAEIGYLHVHWTGNFDTHDWVTDETSELYHTPQEIFEQVLNLEKQDTRGLNGVIILMHLGSQRQENHIFEILPKLIQEVRDRGYTFCTITELLQSPEV